MSEPRVIWSRLDAEELCAELLEQPVVAFDTEWYKYDRTRHNANNGLAFCLTFCYESEVMGRQTIYVHNYGKSEGNIWALQPWFANEDCAKIAHNLPSDYQIVRNHGLKIEGQLIDTMVADYLLDERNENAHTIGDCMARYFGVQRLAYDKTFGVAKLRADGEAYATGQLIVPSMEEVYAQGGGPETIVTYACHDAEDAWDLKVYRVPSWRRSNGGTRPISIISLSMSAALPALLRGWSTGGCRSTRSFCASS